MNKVRILAILCGVVAAVFMVVKRRHAQPTGDVVSAGDASSLVIPELSANDEEALTLDVETETMTAPAGKLIRFRVAGGQVALKLYRAPGAEGSPDMAFGDGAIECADAKSGAALLGKLAGWLKVTPPTAPATPGQLRPLRLTYARLGGDDTWEANKLFLDDDTEVFFNLRHDGRQARFVEKDEEYRDGIVRLLAVALRDGQPPRRTPATDPSFASAAPLVAHLRPVAAPRGNVVASAWLGEAWLAAVHDKGTSRLLRWDNFRQSPRLIAEVKGRLDGLTASPKQDRAAALLLHPKDGAAGVSSEDEGELVVFSLADGAPRTVATSEPECTLGILTRPVWSPDGTRLAITCQARLRKDGNKRPTILRAYDAASGKRLDSRPRDELLVLESWDGDAVTLQELVIGKDPPGKRTWRWRPGSPELVAARPEAQRERRSPDGRFHARFEAGALQIRDGKDVQRFTPVNEGDKASLANDSEPRWLGGHALVLVADAELVLDLATRKLRYLLPDDGSRFESASAGGHLVLARNAERALVWGETEASDASSSKH